MKEDNVKEAFTLAKDELSALIESMKEDAAKNILESNFSLATSIMTKINIVNNFITRVTQVQEEWLKIQNSISDDPIVALNPEEKSITKQPLLSNSKRTPTDFLVLKSSRTSSNNKDYDLNHHLRGKSKWAIDYFTEIRKRIIELSMNCRETFTKMIIAYSAPQRFCEVHIQTDQLKIWLASPIERLHDPHNLCRDVRHLGRYGTGATEVFIRSLREIDPVIELITQSYEQSNL